MLHPVDGDETYHLMHQEHVNLHTVHLPHFPENVNCDSGRRGSTLQTLSVAWGPSGALKDSDLTQKMKKRPGLGANPTSQYTRLVSTVASTKE